MKRVQGKDAEGQLLNTRCDGLKKEKEQLKGKSKVRREPHEAMRCRLQRRESIQRREHQTRAVSAAAGGLEKMRVHI